MPAHPLNLAAVAAAALVCAPLNPQVTPPTPPPRKPLAGVVYVVFANPELQYAENAPWVIAKVDRQAQTVSCKATDSAGLQQYLPVSGKAGCTGVGCPRMTLFVNLDAYKNPAPPSSGTKTATAALSGDGCSGNPVGGSGGDKGFIDPNAVLQMASGSDSSVDDAANGR